MKFSEIFTDKKGYNVTNRLSNFGPVYMNKNDITKKNKTLTPHFEIEESIKMYTTIPIVQSGVDQLALFVIPNKEIKISSKDSKTVKFLEEWHKQRKGKIEEIRNLYITSKISGNGALERHYSQLSDNRRVLDNFYSFNDPTRIFVNPDDMEGNKAFIYQLPIGTVQFTFMGEVQTPNFYKVTYRKNYQFVHKMVYGITIPAWKLVLWKTGWSADGLYGRSALASGINAGIIYNRIMSSWDTISKTKSIDQKILTIADPEIGSQMADEDLQDIEDRLEYNANKAYTILNIPFKPVETNINTSGNYDLMENVMDFLRRSIMMNLIPNYLTPFSDSGTTQGAEAAMPPFKLRIKAEQNSLIHFLNENIIDELRKTYPWLAEDASYVLDEPMLLPPESYIRTATDLVNAGIMNNKQAFNMLTNMGIVDANALKDNQKTTSVVMGGEQEKISHNFHEAIQPNNSFAQWKETMKKFKVMPVEEIDALKLYKFDSILNRPIRIVENDEYYYLFESIKLQSKFKKEFITKATVLKAFDDYKKLLRKQAEEINTEETEEDLVIKELEKEVSDEMQKRIDKLFSTMTKSEVKRENFTEGFLSMKIFPRLDNIFKGFDSFINNSVNKVMKKFGLDIIDDGGIIGKVGKSDKKKLMTKRDLMVKNMRDQIKVTKNNTLQDIKRTLSQGIADGQDVKSIRDRLNVKYLNDKSIGYKLNRTIGTETRQAMLRLKLQKWKKQGINSIIYVSREDKKTRLSHAKKNGKIFLIDDLLNGKIKDTFLNSINCRCTALPYYT